MKLSLSKLFLNINLVRVTSLIQQWVSLPPIAECHRKLYKREYVVSLPRRNNGKRSIACLKIFSTSKKYLCMFRFGLCSKPIRAAAQWSVFSRETFIKSACAAIRPTLVKIQNLRRKHSVDMCMIAL